MGKTYTEDELQAAVASAISEATAELASELKALKDAAQVSEVAAAVSAAKAETAKEIEDLRAALDNAVLAAQAAKSEFEAFKADLEELASAETAAAETAARKAARVEEAKAFGFPESHLEANAERFAAMSDEDWEFHKSNWAVVAPKGEIASDDRIPAKTALTAAREDTNTKSGMNAIRDLMRGGLVGVDPRTL